MSELSQNLDDINLRQQKLAIEKQIALDKAFRSTDPDAIIKAQQVLKDVDKRTDSDTKSYLFDPLAFATSLGYKDVISAVSYSTLRRMAKAPIIKAIIQTRIEQVAAFSEPQVDKYTTGFVIRKKQFGLGDNKVKEQKGDQKKIEYLTNFILNCGENANSWHGDTFDSFLRKITADSLVMDQMCFEVVRNRRGMPIEFIATDASTYRLAESFDEDEYKGREKDKINGYFPSYVQIYNNQIKAEFYPWELCFGVRNPQTNIYTNGYGQSELEDLIYTVTSMLYADQYNSNFFRTGSAPKGILKVSGNVNETRLHELRQQWMGQMAGVQNAHKMMVMEAEKMDFIPTQTSNADMEYGKYQEYMIKVCCAIFKISPEEIGFPLDRPGTLNNSGPKDDLEFSKDKGLTPLLKFIQAKINKYIINPLDPTMEIAFVGHNTESEDHEVDLDTKKVSAYMTLNEVREARGLDPIDGGDIVLNQQYVASKGQAMMGNPDSNEAVDGMDDQNENPFKESDDEEESNPMLKSLSDFWKSEMTDKL